MKTILVIVGLALVGVLGGTQAPQLAAIFQGNTMTQKLTPTQLFDQTRAVLEEVAFLQWVPCSVDPDYRYGACFVREEGKGQNELNAVLPKLLEQRGIEFTKIESGDRNSSGMARSSSLPGLWVSLEINEFEVSATLWSKSGLLRNDPKQPAWGNFTYKSLREASRDIMGRLLGGAETVNGRVDCNPSSQHAYCVKTKETASDILNRLIRVFASDSKSEMLSGYKKGSFDVSESTLIYKSPYLSIRYTREKSADLYKVWLLDFKKKEFSIFYTKNSAGDGALQVEARWIDGYTPAPEEK